MRKNVAGLLVCVCIATGYTGCGRDRGEPEANVAEVAKQPRASTPRIVERMRDLLAPTKLAWHKRVADAAADPEAPLEACALLAEEIEHDLYRFGRTSHRPRNPANAPEPWMDPILLELRQRPPRRFAARVADLPEGRLAYAEPIYTQRSCERCHGPAITPALGERISRAYPDDHATGFVEGDLQGLFWVIFEPELLGAKVERPN